MAAQKDSSVLFSLKELMSLEEDRVRQEEVERERVAEDLRRAQAERDQRARDEEVARMRAADEQRRAHEERTRAEAARLDAIRQGEIERARVEAENAARIDVVRRQQDHERELVALQEKSGRKRLTVMLACLAVALVTAVVGAGFALRETQRQAAVAQAESTKLQQDLLRNEQERKAIEAQRAGKSDEEIRKLEQRLRELQEQRIKLQNDGAPKKPSIAPGSGAAPAKRKNDPNCQKTCKPGDPLCVECE